MKSAFHHEKRVKLSEQKTAKLFLERGKKCGICRYEFRVGDKRKFIVEHILALENGGNNDWNNLGITCECCKPQKDAEDHGKAAKSRRRSTKHHLPSHMRSGGFRKAPPGMRYSWREGRYIRDEDEDDT